MSEPMELASTELADIPQLKDLVEELFDVQHMWYAIGLQLNIPHGVLDNIEKSCRDDHGVGLRCMLKEWYNREKLCTWGLVVKALRCRSVAQYKLAKNLHDRYIPGNSASREQRSPAVVAPDQRSVVPFRSLSGAACKSDNCQNILMVGIIVFGYFQ